MKKVKCKLCKGKKIIHMIRGQKNNSHHNELFIPCPDCTKTKVPKNLMKWAEQQFQKSLDDMSGANDDPRKRHGEDPDEWHENERDDNLSNLK